VTGIGMATPFGVGTKISWEGIISGTSAVRRLEGEAYANLPCKVAASVPRGPDPHQFDSSSLADYPSSRTAPFVQLAILAADEALADAVGAGGAGHSLVQPKDIWGEEMLARMAVCIGSGIGALGDMVEAGKLVTASPRKLSPFFVPKILLNMAGGNIAIRHGIKGPNHTMVTACAAGAHNIMDAAKMIALGEVDAALAGGTESCMEPLAVAGFSRAKSLACDFNDEPGSASRPFDARRCGFVMGEGSAVLVLEELELARSRGARIYAEVAGGGNDKKGSRRRGAG